MRRLLGLGFALLLLQGCIRTGPPGNAPFAEIAGIAALEGVYRNLGEREEGGTPVYLSSLIWPDRKDHDAIASIEVKAIDARTLLVKARTKDGIAKEDRFVEGKDFEIRDGRIRLKEAIGFIGPVESQAHAVGPTYEQREIGIDRKGHGKLTQRTAIVGLVMMIPMAIGAREDVRFRRLDR